jgi:hypothetical protein
MTCQQYHETFNNGAEVHLHLRQLRMELRDWIWGDVTEWFMDAQTQLL